MVSRRDYRSLGSCSGWCRFLLLIPVIFVLPHLLSLVDFSSTSARNEAQSIRSKKLDHLVLGPVAGVGFPDRLHCRGTKALNETHLVYRVLMDSTLNPNKHLKEQFVSNLDGSSILEIAALLTIVPLLVLLRYSIGFHCRIDNNDKPISSKKSDDEIVVYRNWKANTCDMSLDFIFIVFPILLFFTVLSDWVYLGVALLSLLLLVLSVTAKRVAERTISLV